MNSVYTIMTPTKIPLGKMDKSINNSFIEESRKFPNDEPNHQYGRVRACHNPKFITKLSLHLEKTIQDNFIRPYLFHILLDLFMESTHYAPSRKSIIESYEKNIDIKEMWMVEYDENTYFNLHSHCSAPNYYSFVWYLKCDDNRKIIFMSDNKEHEVTVSEGDIIVFPGWLPHRAIGANSICCSGNFRIEVKL